MGEMIAKHTEGMAAAGIEESSQYLTFKAGGETLAISILEVNEIIEITAMTRVPMAPDFIRGVINLRGNVVPVVDLSSRLGREKSELTKRSCIVLVEVSVSNDESQAIGMLVDEVSEILDIDANHVQPPPKFGTDIRTDFIQAMGRIDDLFIILLDINHVLSVEELAAVNEVAEAHGRTEH
jgi:purine-binding chemotaxis protein CheW